MSQALAVRHSRFAVDGETLRTHAASSMVSPAERAKLHDSRQVLIDPCQAIEGLIECKDRNPVRPRHLLRFINRDAREPVASLDRVMAPSVIDEDPAHDLRCHAEKVCPIPPIHVPLVNEPQIHLVNQGRGLERVAGSLTPKMPRRHPTQLRVDQRQQLIERTLVASAPVTEQRRDIAGSEGIGGGRFGSHRIEGLGLSRKLGR